MGYVHWKDLLKEFEGSYDEERMNQFENWIDVHFRLGKITPQEAADGYFSLAWVATYLSLPKAELRLWKKIREILPDYDPSLSLNIYVNAMRMDILIRGLKEGLWTKMNRSFSKN